ncbi:MAG: hypothetical protein JJU36_17195 [Phycisphaeraceae bacterium]|nr:hypothetical protein [Phycisphaeraceae bacterium]
MTDGCDDDITDAEVMLVLAAEFEQFASAGLDDCEKIDELRLETGEFLVRLGFLPSKWKDWSSSRHLPMIWDDIIDSIVEKHPSVHHENDLITQANACRHIAEFLEPGIISANKREMGPSSDPAMAKTASSEAPAEDSTPADANGDAPQADGARVPSKPDPFMPAAWFKSPLRHDRYLRQLSDAVKAKTPSKRIRRRGEKGAYLYSVRDAMRAWPDKVALQKAGREAIEESKASTTSVDRSRESPK